MSNNALITYYIYEITNNLNGKTYIGQRQCPVRKTPETDTNYMGKGTAIQAAEKKYGIENFSKRILAVCYSTKIIDILEVEYIHTYKEIGKAEYNIAGGGQTRCREFMNEEQKKRCNKRISEGIRNSEKWHNAMHSDEFRAKISETHKGLTPPNKGKKMSKEFCNNVSQAINDMYNSPKGDVVRDKIKKARANQIITEETRKKMSESQKGKVRSEETRKRMSAAQKGHTVSDKTKQLLREKRKLQAPMSEEAKLRRKQSIAEYWNSPKGQEQKRINSELMCNNPKTKGLHWYNNGEINVVDYECPEGFVPGRIGNFSQSEETKQKKSDWYKNLTEEQRKEYKQHLSESHKGFHFNDEQKKHIGDANRGRKYYNNGIIEVMRFEQPDGFVPGRLPSIKEKIAKGTKKALSSSK